MSGAVPIALAVALAAVAFIVGVLVVLTRRVVDHSGRTHRARRAAHRVAGHPIAAQGPGRRLRAQRRPAPAGLTGSDGVALYDGDGRLLAADPPDDRLWTQATMLDRANAPRADSISGAAPGADSRPDTGGGGAAAARRRRRRARCARRGEHRRPCARACSEPSARWRATPPASSSSPSSTPRAPGSTAPRSWRCGPRSARTSSTTRSTRSPRSCAPTPTAPASSSWSSPTSPATPSAPPGSTRRWPTNCATSTAICTLERARFGDAAVGHAAGRARGAQRGGAVPGAAAPGGERGSARSGRPGQGGSVEIIARDEGSDCVITVEDDGVGMDPEALRAGPGDALGDGEQGCPRRADQCRPSAARRVRQRLRSGGRNGGRRRHQGHHAGAQVPLGRPGQTEERRGGRRHERRS